MRSAGREGFGELELSFRRVDLDFLVEDPRKPNKSTSIPRQ